MTAARQRLGRRGESLVARALARRGWRVVARNARVPGIRGELDIVALDGQTLVFVEVKTLSADTRGGPCSPLEVIGPRKRAQLRRLASAWIAANRALAGRFAAVRIDAVGLRLRADGSVAAHEHVRSAC